MNSSNKTPDDSLKRALLERFDGFEPDAPPFFETIQARLDGRKTWAKYGAPLRKASLLILLVLVSNPLSHRLLPDRLPPVADLNETVSDRLPIQHYAIVSTHNPQASPPPLPVILQRDSDTGTPAEEPVGIPPFTMVLPPRQFDELPVRLTAHEIAFSAAQPAPVEEKTFQRKSVRFVGGLSLDNTQYRLTVLPQKNFLIRDFQFPAPWSSANWKPRGYVGAEYRNWQLLLAYKEFTQVFDFQINKGQYQVSYENDTDYTISSLDQSATLKNNFRFIGINLRKLIPLKARGVYLGVGGGQYSGINHRSHSSWAQALIGRNIPLNRNFDLFVEGQVQHSLRRASIANPDIRYTPYQIGITTGLKWKGRRSPLPPAPDY